MLQSIILNSVVNKQCLYNIHKNKNPQNFFIIYLLRLLQSVLENITLLSFTNIRILYFMIFDTNYTNM